MGQDIIARGLVTRSLAKHEPAIDDFGGATAASRTANSVAFADAFASGVRVLALPTGTYEVEQVATGAAVRSYTQGQQPAIILPEDLRLLDGQGSTIAFRHSRGIQASSWTTWAYPAVQSELAASVLAGDVQVTLSAGEGANWTVGDTALWRFGSLPYDKPEALDWGLARIRAIDGDTVTLDRPLPQDFDPASVDADAFTSNFGTTWYNRSLHKWSIFDGLEVRDLVGEGNPGTTVEEFLTVRGGRKVSIRRCGARNVGIGFALQYVEGAVIEDCFTDDGNPFQVSVGKGVSMAECRDIAIRNFRGKGLTKCISLEAGSYAHVSGGLFENTGRPDDGTSYAGQCIVFNVMGKSQITVQDFTITGYGGYQLVANKNGLDDYNGIADIGGRLTMIHPTEPGHIDLTMLSGMLDYRIAGQHELFDFRTPRVWRRRIWLRNGLNQNLRGPNGAIVRARIYASSGLTFGTGGQLPALWIGRDTHNGINYADQLVAGSDVDLRFLGGDAGGEQWFRRAEQVKLLIATESGTSLDNTDQYLDIEFEIAPDLLSSQMDWSNEQDQRNSGQGGRLREAVFYNFNVPSVAAGASWSFNLAVPNIASDDFVHAVEMLGNIGQMRIVSTDAYGGLVNVTFHNPTGAAIDLGSTTLRVLWSKSLTSG